MYPCISMSLLPYFTLFLLTLTLIFCVCPETIMKKSAIQQIKVNQCQTNRQTNGQINDWAATAKLSPREMYRAITNKMPKGQGM